MNRILNTESFYMKMTPHVLLFALVLSGTTHAADLLDVFRSALTNDPVFAAHTIFLSLFLLCFFSLFAKKMHTLMQPYLFFCAQDVQQQNQ